MQTLIDQYIESKRNSWSKNTLRSEGYRLRGLTTELLGNPELLWTELTGKRSLKPYAAKTLMVRASSFVEYLIDVKILTGTNVIKSWLRINANKFKYAYKAKKVEMTFEEATKRIATITNAGLKEKAMQLLVTGMRFEESVNVRNGIVIGKGGLQREVPLANAYQASEFDQSYTTLYRELKKLGLTPHMLRKLCATKMASLGARESDMMALFGWRSMAVASIYVQAQRGTELTQRLLKEMAK